MLLRYDLTSARWRCIARHGGSELAYAEKTSDTNITATAEGSADTIITLPAVKLDGFTPVRIEFYAPNVGTTAADVRFYIFDSLAGDTAASLGLFAQASHASANADFYTLAGILNLTPAAGSHVFSCRAITDDAASPGLVRGGTGGPGRYTAAWLALRKR
jgi:hypothetical protein